jgi:hypothetical protein
MWSKLLTASLNEQPKHKKITTDRMIMTGYLGLWQMITMTKQSSAAAWAAGNLHC